jgi:hypothetical protein
MPVLAGALFTRKTPDDLITNPLAHAQIRDRELVWVRLSWLKSFIRQVLPLVTAKFILVTGDSDSSVPSELADVAEIILNCNQIVHWFTQNYDGSAAPDRISPIPIGIDFHMVSEFATWGEAQASPAKQEELLKSIRDSLPPLAHRIPEVYLDFCWQKSWGLRHYRRFHPLKGSHLWETRRRTAARLRNSEFVFAQGSSLPRSEMWRRRGEYAFVLSPHGMGLDCHRTWEALALGHIVLVPSSALDSLFEGLPVVSLRSWLDITPDNLRKWLAEFRDDNGLNERLKTDYWINKMRCYAMEVAHMR